MSEMVDNAAKAEVDTTTKIDEVKDDFAEWKETEDGPEVDTDDTETHKTTEEVDSGEETEEDPLDTEIEKISKTKAFSEALNRARANDHKEIETARKLAEENTKLVNEFRETLKLFGYEGNDSEVLELVRAQAKEISVEELRAQEAEKKAEVERLLLDNPTYKAWIEREQATQAEFVRINDLKEIKKAFPTETALNITDIPNYQVFADLRIKGIDAAQAYKYANADTLAGQKANSAKEKAMKASQKDHLQTVDGGSGEIDIPADVLKSYRQFGFTDKEAAEDYKRMKKG